MESFLSNMNYILNLSNMNYIHAIKKVNKYKFKVKTKPWITPAFQKPISVKNILLKKFIATRDP